MARKGEEARAQVVNIIKEAFGNNFVTIQDKKIYVAQQENGELIQFAISITQPKVPVGMENISIEEDDFFSENPIPKIDREAEHKTQEESVKKLKERLGL